MNTKVKEQIIEKYILLINEYFSLIKKSNIMKEINYPLMCLFVGINSLHRVFEYVLIKSKNIDTAYYYATKSYYYYLEYMEQIYNSNIQLNINHFDIVLFIYKNTIFKIYNAENEDTSNSMNNIMTLINNETINASENDLHDYFSQLLKMTNTLFYWENTDFTFENRVSISEKLNTFIKNIEKTELTQRYLEIIQQKIKMNYGQYENLLKEMINKIKKQKNNKKKSLNEIEIDEYILFKFYVEENIFLEKFQLCNMVDFVKWLYV
jgi:hypothetical protein